jgi:hypothetical protein
MPEQLASVFCRYPHRHDQELLLDPACHLLAEDSHHHAA